jgi:hypothetical protein
MLGQVCLGIIILTFLCGIGSTTMSLVIYSNKEKRVESKPVVPNQYATFVDDEQSASVLIDDYDYDDLEIGDNIHYE